MAQEGDFKNILVAFTLFSLFAFSILVVVNSIGGEYDMDTDQIIEGYNMTGFNDTMHDFETTAERYDEQFQKQSLWSSIAGVIVTGIFDILKGLYTIILTPFALLGAVLVSFGIPTYVVSVLQGILILVLSFAVWRLIKIGS
jgi:hypothetical protein